MKDKKYLIIGAAGLIGKELVNALVLKGANVIAADLSVEVIKKNIPKKVHEKIDVVEIDITSKCAIQKVLKYCEISLGELDGAVNTSYPKTSSFGKDVFQMSFQEFNSNVSVHLGGYFLFMQQCALFAQSQKKDFSLVNLASIYGVVAPKFEIYQGTNYSMPVEYAAIKSGILHLNRYFSKLEFSQYFRVNSVSPGGIFDGQNEKFVAAYKQKCRVKGLLSTDDIMGSIIFLLSENSKYICGQNIVVDDGFII